MAGDWIKVEKVTPRKLEILAIAAKLGIHADHAFGLCFRFWSWCDDNFAETNAPSVSKALVSALVERSDFVDAMVSVGWLIDSGETVVISNFDRHLSQTAKQRALTSRRVAKHESKNTNAKLTLRALAKEEKRREESNKKTKQKKTPDPAQIIFPEELRGTRFPQVWTNWVKYKQERKESIADVTQQQAFSKAIRVGGNVAADALEESMTNGHQGWTFNLDKNGKSQTSGHQPYLPIPPTDANAPIFVPKDRADRMKAAQQ